MKMTEGEATESKECYAGSKGGCDVYLINYYYGLVHPNWRNVFRRVFNLEVKVYVYVTVYTVTS